MPPGSRFDSGRSAKPPETVGISEVPDKKEVAVDTRSS